MIDNQKRRTAMSDDVRSGKRKLSTGATTKRKMADRDDDDLTEGSYDGEDDSSQGSPSAKKTKGSSISGQKDESDMTEEEHHKLEEKRAYNRRNAARARQRIKDQMTELCQKVERFNSKCSNLESENEELGKKILALNAENARLKEFIVLHGYNPGPFGERQLRGPSAGQHLTPFSSDVESHLSLLDSIQRHGQLGAMNHELAPTEAQARVALLSRQGVVLAGANRSAISSMAAASQGRTAFPPSNEAFAQLQYWNNLSSMGRAGTGTAHSTYSTPMHASVGQTSCSSAPLQSSSTHSNVLASFLGDHSSSSTGTNTTSAALTSAAAASAAATASDATTNSNFILQQHQQHAASRFLLAHQYGVTAADQSHLGGINVTAGIGAASGSIPSLADFSRIQQQIFGSLAAEEIPGDEEMRKALLLTLLNRGGGGT